MNLSAYRISGLLLLVIFALPGCLSSDSPFYEARDLTIDGNLVGNYSNEESSLRVQFDRPDKSQQYAVCILFKKIKLNACGSLFKVDGECYIDLLLNPTDYRLSEDEFPTLINSLLGVSAFGSVKADHYRHLIFLIDISKDQLIIKAPKPARELGNQLIGASGVAINEDYYTFNCESSLIKDKMIALGGKKWANLFGPRAMVFKRME